MGTLPKERSLIEDALMEYIAMFEPLYHKTSSPPFHNCSRWTINSHRLLSTPSLSSTVMAQLISSGQIPQVPHRL